MGNQQAPEPVPPARLREMYGDDPERILGVRLRALREETGMTQAQVAEAMTAQGFTMQQTTIAKIEANQRPVRVNEGVMLAAVLGFRLPDLLADPDLTEEAAVLREELREATARRVAIEARRAQLKANHARARAELSASMPEWEKATAAEREAQRLYRLALSRRAGHPLEEG